MLAKLTSNPASISLLIFGGISVINGLFNRIAMTKFFFDYPIVVLLLQMALTLALIETGRFLGLFKLTSYTFQRGKELFAPSLYFSLTSFFCLNSLDGITLALFPFIQCFFPLFVIFFFYYIMRRKPPTISTIGIICLICIGSAFASTYEFDLNPWIIIYSSVSLAITGVSFVYFEKYSEEHSPLEMVYINSFNSLFMFLIADLVQDELRDAYMYLSTSINFYFVLTLLAQVIFGVASHAAFFYAISYAKALNTAIITNMAGTLQIFIACILSIDLFYELKPDFYNIIGSILSFIGLSAFYMSNKDQEWKINILPNKYSLLQKK